VADLALDLVDALEAVAGALDLGDVVGGDDSELPHGLGGQDLDAQPAVELGCGCPDLAHPPMGVAGNHQEGATVTLDFINPNSTVPDRLRGCPPPPEKTPTSTSSYWR